MKQNEKKNFIFLVFGQKGFGKSYLIKQMIKKRLKSKHRFVVVDPNAEYSASFDRAYSRGDFIKQAKQKWGLSSFIIYYTPEKDGDEIFDIVYELGDTTLIIDEAHLWGRGADFDSGLRQIIRMGRHRRINVIMITHRPADLDPLIRMQSDIIISFRQTEMIDIKGFKDFVDDPERLMKLPRGKYLAIKGNLS